MATVNSNKFFLKRELLFWPYFRSQKNGENANKKILIKKKKTTPTRDAIPRPR
jgi:hypothetical protein